MENKGTIRIGTSGIVVPGPKKSFPEEYKSKTRLGYYSTLFNTLEINSSFYKVPLPSTFHRWATEVSGDFKFTVKLWQEITHAKKLAYKEEDIVRFMHSANSLADKRGCLLIQFPASITIEFIDTVERIIRQVYDLNSDGGWSIAVELRHTNWYDARTYEMLQKYKASIVFHDMKKSQPSEVDLSSSVIYLRFHGPEGNYRGNYDDEFLTQTAASIRNWLTLGKDVYAYFNNTMGNAFQNAQELQRLVSRQ